MHENKTRTHIACTPPVSSLEKSKMTHKKKGKKRRGERKII